MYDRASIAPHLQTADQLANQWSQQVPLAAQALGGYDKFTVTMVDTNSEELYCELFGFWLVRDKDTWSSAARGCKVKVKGIQSTQSTG